MKSNQLNNYLFVFILVNIIFVHCIHSIHANHQMIQVYSSYQSIDILTNTIIFKTNVILECKQMQLHADSIMITHDYNTHKISMLQASGNPVIVNHTPESGNTISVQSLIVYYDAIKNIITFSGRACIKQSENSIQSDNITYSVDQKKIEAISKKDGKTITILLIKPI